VRPVKAVGSVALMISRQGSVVLAVMGLPTGDQAPMLGDVL
jgi:hypothetical protein